MVKSSKSKMPELPCLKCGTIIKFPSYIKSQKYDGQVRCQGCNSLMHIKLDNSVVVKCSLVRDNSKESETGLQKGKEFLDRIKKARGRT